jgi:hypothetical protein
MLHPFVARVAAGRPGRDLPDVPQAFMPFDTDAPAPAEATSTPPSARNRYAPVALIALERQLGNDQPAVSGATVGPATGR